MIIGISGKKGSGKDTVAKIINYWCTGGDKTYESIEGFLEYYDDNFEPGNHPRYPFEIKRFADAPKNIVCMLLGCTREQLEDRNYKEQPLGEQWTYYKLSVPSIMIEHTVRKEIYLTEEEAFNDGVDMGYAKSTLIVTKHIHTPRTLMKLVGTECGRQIIHPNIWVNILMKDYKPSCYYMCDKCGDENILPSKLLQIPSRFKEQGYLEDEFVCPNCKGLEDEGDITKVFTDDYSKWIIPDVRFINEVNPIKDRDGIVIRVNRPKKTSKEWQEQYPDVKVLDLNGWGKRERFQYEWFEERITLEEYKKRVWDSTCTWDTKNISLAAYFIEDTHESETALDNYQEFDEVILNEDLEGLIQTVKTILEKYKII